VARKSTDDRSGLPNDGDRPPCEGAGDDRNGPEAPPWVPPARVSNSGSWAAAHDPDAHRTYPTLHAFLTLTGYAGAARQSGTVSVSAEDGMFKAAINDREAGFFAFVSCKTLAGLLDKLEAGLKTGQMDWRPSKYKKK